MTTPSLGPVASEAGSGPGRSSSRESSCGAGRLSERKAVMVRGQVNRGSLTRLKAGFDSPCPALLRAWPDIEARTTGRAPVVIPVHDRQRAPGRGASARLPHKGNRVFEMQFVKEHQVIAGGIGKPGAARNDISCV